MLIGIDLRGKELTSVLDTCLCSDVELAALAAGLQLEDPFAEWPLVEQFLDSGDEEEDEEVDEEEAEEDNGGKASGKKQQGQARSPPATSQPAAKRRHG